MSLSEQFGHPTGLFGRVIGHVMAFKNKERSAWVLDQLSIAPGSHVLEIGFGAGTDVDALARRGALVSGIDHSQEMVRMARRRNAAHRERVELHEGSVLALPWPPECFDCVYSINSVQFWKPLDGALNEIQRVLAPGGQVALALQPRNAGATAETSRAWAETLSAALTGAGFTRVQLRTAEIPPVPTVCALAVKTTPHTSAPP